MRKFSATITANKKRTKWYARLQYYNNATGKRVGVCRSADTKTEAQELLDALKAKYATGTLDARKKTFASLAEELQQSKYAPAQYSESGMKLSGVRNAKNY